ncbi:MAG: hypothetical protein KGK35_05675, partial [Xanthomonadaceae bacterium]|nr:hypothetical protein [Xanthomonadaceae bacterium]
VASELSQYNIQLAALRAGIVQSRRPHFESFASGFDTYMTTFRALGRPEQAETGRELWRLLSGGAAGYLEDMSKARPEMDRQQMLELLPMPNTFIAEAPSLS